jgi:hypothetical protein
MSTFQTEVGNKEAAVSLCTKLRDLADKTVESSIPSDTIKDMVPAWKCALGVLTLVGGFVFFITFLAIGINNAKNTQYLSPESEKTAYCDDVPSEVTGIFYATSDGYFSRNTQFTYPQALYQFTLDAYATTASKWSKDVHGIAFYIKNYMGPKALKQSLGQNIPFYTNVAAIGTDSQSTRFTLTGDIKIVLDQPNILGKVGSKAGICDEELHSSYDKTSGILSVTIDVEAFLNNSICATAISSTALEAFGYNSFYNGKFFTLKFDVQTILTAFVLNTGVMVTSAYTKVIEINGVTSYIDPKYPGMKVVQCVEVQGKTLCGVPVGSVIVLPIFSDMGANPYLGEPTQCDCTDLSDESLYGLYGACHFLQFFTGVMLWSDYIYNSAPYLNFGETNQDYAVAMSSMFNAMYATSLWGTVKNYNANSTFLVDAFEPCDYEGSSCTLINFSLFNSNPSFGYSISDYYYQLLYGACNDSFVISDAAASQMSSYPYASLVESYVTCTDSYSTIVLNSIGISSGNTSTFLSMLVLLLIAVAYTYQYFTGDKINPTFTSEERNDALEAFAVSLLLQRDRKHEFNNRGSTKAQHSFPLLEQLIDELNRSAAYNPDRKLLGLSDLLAHKVFHVRDAEEATTASTRSPMTEMVDVQRIYSDESQKVTEKI